jgi:hypothetical protein
MGGIQPPTSASHVQRSSIELHPEKIVVGAHMCVAKAGGARLLHT